MSKVRLLNMSIRKSFDVSSCTLLSVIVLCTLLGFEISLTIFNNNLNDILLTLIQSSYNKLEISKILDSFINNNNKEFALHVYAESDTNESLSYDTINLLPSINKININTNKTFSSTNTLFSSSKNSPVISNSTMKKVSQANQPIISLTPSVLSFNPSQRGFSIEINQQTQQSQQIQQQLQQMNKQNTNQYSANDDKIQSDKQRIKQYEKLFISELLKIDYKLANQIKDDIEAAFGSITKLCKITVNENLSKDNLELILNNIILNRSNNSEYPMENLQYPQELLQYPYSNNYSNSNSDINSNLVNNYKSSYHNNYNTINNNNNPDYRENRDRDIVIKEDKINNENNKNDIKYQYYKES